MKGLMSILAIALLCVSPAQARQAVQTEAEALLSRSGAPAAGAASAPNSERAHAGSGASCTKRAHA